MKPTQKIKVVIEDVTYVTSFKELDDKLKPIALKLEESEDSQRFGVNGLHVTSGNAQLCVCVSYVGVPPKLPKKIFGMDESVLMAKQYK